MEAALFLDVEELEVEVVVVVVGVGARVEAALRVDRRVPREAVDVAAVVRPLLEDVVVEVAAVFGGGLRNGLALSVASRRTHALPSVTRHMNMTREPRISSQQVQELCLQRRIEYERASQRRFAGRSIERTRNAPSSVQGSGLRTICRVSVDICLGRVLSKVDATYTVVIGTLVSSRPRDGEQQSANESVASHTRTSKHSLQVTDALIEAIGNDDLGDTGIETMKEVVSDVGSSGEPASQPV